MISILCDFVSSFTSFLRTRWWPTAQLLTDLLEEFRTTLSCDFLLEVTKKGSYLDGCLTCRNASNPRSSALQRQSISFSRDEHGDTDQRGEKCHPSSDIFMPPALPEAPQKLGTLPSHHTAMHTLFTSVGAHTLLIHDAASTQKSR